MGLSLELAIADAAFWQNEPNLSAGAVILFSAWSLHASALDRRRPPAVFLIARCSADPGVGALQRGHAH
jgi:hypothetical protein